ncbi:LuxR C-terminal-related transcriptional regulator [Streptomyces sp. PU_AKi4]|uniref:LuxR C-terminal-related transcriptional regulator n=1 Tax=Streptomyces sp. PU_AKi4 TaxID=2800809 RepID=UPI0035258F45
MFGLIAAGEPVPDADTETVRELAALGFVVVEDGPGNRPVALNPETVARRRMESMLREAAERVARLSALPGMMDQLAGPYARGQWTASAGSEYIDDAAVVNARLDDVVGAAEREILAAQPGGPRTEAQLERSLARDTAALDRGVVKRTLYRATVRDTQVTARYARHMSTRAGRQAEFRTLEDPFERAIIVDRRVAFISNHLVEEAPAHSAWQITDQAMVAYIAAEFEAKWRRADPWHGEIRGRTQAVDTIVGPGQVRTTRRQREIMRDMVDGHSQQATASRLGVSVRTVSDDINALRDLFDARSREQLAFKWASSLDRLVDDSAPDAGTSGAENGAGVAA